MEARRILWIEDDADMLMGLVRPLEKDGHEIIVAMDEIEALEKIKENKFDLILFDIIIPTGVKEDPGDVPFVGMELLKKLKDMNITTPIIVLSVMRNKKMINKMYEMGVKKVLPKGAYLPSKLKKEIYDVLGLRDD